jgi:hypothetical protein
MSGNAFGIHIGLAILSCVNRHAGLSQLAGAPDTGPAGRTHGLVNPPNETGASSSALRATAARPESEEDRTRFARSEFFRVCRVARRNLTPGRSQNRA